MAQVVTPPQLSSAPPVNAGPPFGPLGPLGAAPAALMLREKRATGWLCLQYSDGRVAIPWVGGRPRSAFSTRAADQLDVLLVEHRLIAAEDHERARELARVLSVPIASAFVELQLATQQDIEKTRARLAELVIARAMTTGSGASWFEADESAIASPTLVDDDGLSVVRLATTPGRIVPIQQLAGAVGGRAAVLQAPKPLVTAELLPSELRVQGLFEAPRSIESVMQAFIAEGGSPEAAVHAIFVQRALGRLVDPSTIADTKPVTSSSGAPTSPATTAPASAPASVAKSPSGAQPAPPHRVGLPTPMPGSIHANVGRPSLPTPMPGTLSAPRMGSRTPAAGTSLMANAAAADVVLPAGSDTEALEKFSQTRAASMKLDLADPKVRATLELTWLAATLRVAIFQRRFADALPYAERMLLKSASDPSIVVAAALARMHAGPVDRRVQQLDVIATTARKFPEAPDAQAALARACIVVGQRARAIAAIDALERVAPNDPRLPDLISDVTALPSANRPSLFTPVKHFLREAPSGAAFAAVALVGLLSFSPLLFMSRGPLRDTTSRAGASGLPCQQIQRTKRSVLCFMDKPTFAAIPVAEREDRARATAEGIVDGSTEVLLIYTPVERDWLYRWSRRRNIPAPGPAAAAARAAAAAAPK